MQKRDGGEGVSVVIGGEAGAAEGDFTSCMLWSTRPNRELPVLMIVTNNGYGISTTARSQISASPIERAAAFGIPGESFDGNDPVASWHAVDRAISYCRQTRHPYILEARVSRLHGHSSSSGSQRVAHEVDCLESFERKLLEVGIIDAHTLEALHNDATDEMNAAVALVMREPHPRPDDVERFTYAPSPVDAVYPEDYTGLPR